MEMNVKGVVVIAHLSNRNPVGKLKYQTIN